MIGQRYYEKKQAVLDICERYLRFRGDTADGVDPDFLQKRMEALRDARYTLAVVGEAKAGKSTFINALLGESILPTDVLQSSSAVVEIFKSEEKYVEVEYADGNVKTFEDDPNTPDLDEAAQHLRYIGAIQDRYRVIPTTMLDARIVEGSIAPGRPLPIADLEAASGLKRLHDKEALILEYVKTRKLADIPQKITFGFPLKYAFDGFRLVDSPGVSARGGVQDATYDYVQEANALLFVHSIRNQIESESLLEFVTKVAPDRTLETLFLILTQSGMESEIEIDAKVGEARRLYQEKFNQDRILHVDSMLKIISEEIEQFDSAASLKKHYRERRTNFNKKYKQEKYQVWRDEAVKFDIKLKLLNNVLDDLGDDSDRQFVQKTLRDSSNFDEMEHVIEEFSSRAPELQLSELLKSVKSGYEAQDQNLEGNISVLEAKRERPQTFEREISKIQGILEDYKLLMNRGSEKVTKNFTGRQASYRQSLKKITTNYREKISQAQSLDSVKKILIDFHDKMTSFADKKGEHIKSNFENEMKRLGEEFKAKHNITLPTAIDFSGIEAETKGKAYSNVKVARDPKGVWEWTQKIITLGLKNFYEEKTVYDTNKHLNLLKTDARKAMETKEIEFDELVGILIAKIVPNFRSFLKTRIDVRTSELEDIKASKMDNEKLLKKITEAKREKQDNKKRLARVSEMLANLS